MARKLTGKVALVTGGSAGIGLGIAERFAEEGARVFITGRRQFQLDEAVASIGNAAAILGDTSDLADLDRIFAEIRAQAGRINVLSPGTTATPGLSHFMTEEEKASAIATVPLGRIGTPDDLAKAAVFLASDDSAYITGIELFVDGGAVQI